MPLHSTDQFTRDLLHSRAHAVQGRRDGNLGQASLFECLQSVNQFLPPAHKGTPADRLNSDELPIFRSQKVMPFPQPKMLLFWGN